MSEMGHIVKAASLERWFDRYFVQATVLPTFLVMVCVFGLPLVFSFYLSFTGWGLEQPLFAGRFVGLANYDDVLSNSVFKKAIYITLGYTAATVAAQMLLGLGIALLLNVDGRDRIFSLVKARYPDSDPLDKILDWTFDLAQTRVVGMNTPNALGIENFGDIDLSILENLLRGKSETETIEALSAEYGTEKLVEADPDGKMSRIRNSVIFRPLLSE